jgi:hypothetical protein
MGEIKLRTSNTFFLSKLNEEKEVIFSIFAENDSEGNVEDAFHMLSKVWSLDFPVNVEIQASLSDLFKSFISWHGDEPIESAEFLNALRTECLQVIKKIDKLTGRDE